MSPPVPAAGHCGVDRRRDLESRSVSQTCGVSNFRSNAEDEAAAYAMRDDADRGVRVALIAPGPSRGRKAAAVSPQSSVTRLTR
jgi:hypothetical protein